MIDCKSLNLWHHDIIFKSTPLAKIKINMMHVNVDKTKYMVMP